MNKLFVIISSFFFFYYSPLSAQNETQERDTSNAEWDSAVLPQFPGGEAAMIATIKNNLRFTKKERKKVISGKVLVQFIIEKNGELSNFNIVQSLSPMLDEKALNAVKSLPRFIPATKNGVPVRLYYIIPITFKVRDKSK